MINPFNNDDHRRFVRWHLGMLKFSLVIVALVLLFSFIAYLLGMCSK